MACWAARAKWVAGTAFDGQRDVPLARGSTNWLGSAAYQLRGPYYMPQKFESKRWLGDTMTTSVVDEAQRRQMTDSGAYPGRAAALCAAQQTPGQSAAKRIGRVLVGLPKRGATRVGRKNQALAMRTTSVAQQ